MGEPENPGRIPIGNTGAYIDLTTPTKSYLTLAKESRFSKQCFERCNPDAAVTMLGQHATMQLCMQDVLQGGVGGEHVIEIAVDCPGPQGITRKKCPALSTAQFIVTSLPFGPDHPEQGPADENNP